MGNVDQLRRLGDTEHQVVVSPPFHGSVTVVAVLKPDGTQVWLVSDRLLYCIVLNPSWKEQKGVRGSSIYNAAVLTAQVYVM